MKVGLTMPSFFPTVGAQMTIEAAHAAGADSLWTIDHMLGVFHPAVYGATGLAELAPDPDGLLDPFCLCAWAGTATQLPVGIAVTDGIRRGAADVARAALSLQHLCPGGFNLGVGCGEAENLIPFGYRFDRPVAALASFLADLRVLLDGETMPRHGGRLGLPRRSAAGPPQVWVAAHRPRMLALAGRFGDGWLPVEVPGAEEYARLRGVVAEHARAAGRAAPECGMFAVTVLGSGRDRLREMFEAQPMAKLLAAWFAPAATWAKYDLPYPGGDGGRGYVDVIPHDLDPALLRDLAPRIPFALLEEHFFLGGADEIAARLRPYGDAGLEHVVLFNLTGLVGGLAEAAARGPELVRLCRLLTGSAIAPNAQHATA